MLTLILLIGFAVFIFYLSSRSQSSVEKNYATPAASDKYVSLRSDRGLDYSRLQELLKRGRWEEADSETGYCMSRVIGEDQPLRWSAENLLNFSGTDLKMINELWLTYSDGRFGFSVQKKIYIESGANLEDAIPDEVALRDFYTRLGWPIKIAGNNLIVGSDLNYSTAAPLGHLPGPFHAIWIKTERGRNFWLNGSDSNLPSYWQMDDKGGLDTFFGLPLLLCHRDL